MSESVSALRTEIAGLLPRLRRFARVLTRNVEDADDLVQIAVERALTHTAQWQPGSRLDSWLFRIMKNAWIDEIRARVRRHEIFAAEEEGANVAASDGDPHIDALAVRIAMEQLSDDHRLAIGLVLVEGLPYKEAAEVLEIPIGTLTSRLARGREILQALLSGAKRSDGRAP